MTRKRLPSLLRSEEQLEEDPKQKLKVTMVGWSQDDHMVMTAVNDHSIKVWDSHSGKLKHTLLVSASLFASFALVGTCDCVGLCRYV